MMLMLMMMMMRMMMMLKMMMMMMMIDLYFPLISEVIDILYMLMYLSYIKLAEVSKRFNL